MPTTRPSDKGEDNAEWWKGTQPEDQDIPDPNNTPDNNQAMRANKYAVEQEEVAFPT
jgi:hypothetical protein